MQLSTTEGAAEKLNLWRLAKNLSGANAIRKSEIGALRQNVVVTENVALRSAHEIGGIQATEKR